MPLTKYQNNKNENKHNMTHLTSAILAFFASLWAASASNTPLVMSHSGTTYSISDDGIAVGDAGNPANSTVLPVLGMGNIISLALAEDPDNSDPILFALGSPANSFPSRNLSICQIASSNNSCTEFTGVDFSYASPGMDVHDGIIVAHDGPVIFQIEYDTDTGIILEETGKYLAYSEHSESSVFYTEVTDVLLLDSATAVFGWVGNSTANQTSTVMMLPDSNSVQLDKVHSFVGTNTNSHALYTNKKTGRSFVYRNDQSFFDPSDEGSAAQLEGPFGLATDIAVNQDTGILLFSGANSPDDQSITSIYAFDIASDPLDPKLIGFLPLENVFDFQVAVATPISGDLDEIAYFDWLEPTVTAQVVHIDDFLPYDTPSDAPSGSNQNIGGQAVATMFAFGFAAAGMEWL